MGYANSDAIIGQLWTPDAQGNKPRIFALLDGARDKRIVPKLRTLPSYERQCLLTGGLTSRLAMAAPYLVRLYPDRPITRWLIEEGWGDAWGVFCATDIDIDGLGLHFKKLLRVKDESGRNLYFRFYDPRVLRAFLPTCTPAQVNQILGPASILLLEDPASNGPVTVSRRSRAADFGSSAMIIRKQQLDQLARARQPERVEQPVQNRMNEGEQGSRSQETETNA